MHGFCSAAFASHLRSKAIMNHPQFKMVAWFTLSICQARCYTFCHRNWIKTPYKLRSQKPQLHSKELCMTCLIASTCNSWTATIIRTQDERYCCQHSPVTFVIFIQSSKSEYRRFPFDDARLSLESRFRSNSANQNASIIRCWRECLTFKPNTFRNHKKAWNREHTEEMLEHQEMHRKRRSDIKYAGNNSISNHLCEKLPKSCARLLIASRSSLLHRLCMKGSPVTFFLRLESRLNFPIWRFQKVRNWTSRKLSRFQFVVQCRDFKKN